MAQIVTKSRSRTSSGSCVELEVADVWRSRSRAVETEGRETWLTHSYSCLPTFRTNMSLMMWDGT